MINTMPDNYLLIERFLNELLLKENCDISLKFNASLLVMKGYYIRFTITDIGIIGIEKYENNQKIMIELLNNSNFEELAKYRDTDKFLFSQLEENIEIKKSCFKIDHHGLIIFYNDGSIKSKVIMDCINIYQQTKSLA